MLIAAAFSCLPAFAFDPDSDPLTAGEANELAKFDALIKKNPKDAKAYHERAKCYLILCQDDKALVDLNRTIELAPQGYGAYEERADLLASHGHKLEAVHDCDVMIKLRPKNPKGFERRAIMYQSLGRLKDALADCDRAIQLSEPGHVTGWQYKCSIYIEQKDDVNAVKCLTKLIEIDPKNRVNYHGRANYYVKQGKYDLAVQDLSQAIKICSSDPESEPFIMRGDVYRKMNRFADAIADYTHAIKLDERRSGQAYFGRAQCEKALGQEFQRDLKRSQQLGYEEKTSKPIVPQLKPSPGASH